MKVKGVNMWKRLLVKIKGISFLKERLRFLVFCVVLLVSLFLVPILFRRGFSAYYSDIDQIVTKTIDKAIYLINDNSGDITIPVDLDLAPGKTYNYNFVVQNWDGLIVSQADVSYTLDIISTANFPLDYKLSKRTLVDDTYVESAFSQLSYTSKTVLDEDSTKYNKLSYDENILKHSTKTTVYYNLDITFLGTDDYTTRDTLASEEGAYKYTNYLESIEIIIDSKNAID